MFNKVSLASALLLLHALTFTLVSLPEQQKAFAQTESDDVPNTFSDASENLNEILALIAALKDADSGVRMNAALALGKLRDEQAVPALIAALKDEDSGVRMHAASALGVLGDRQAVPALIAALKDADEYVCMNAAAALDELGHHLGPSSP